MKLFFTYLSKRLHDQQYLMGSAFTVADGYLFTVLNWSNQAGIELGNWPVLMGSMDRLRARPGVQAALRAEGLLK